MVWAEDEASHSIPYRKPGPEQGPSLFHLWKLRAARKWQKKRLMLAEGGSRGLRGEAISMTWKCGWSSKCWCRSCSKLSRRSDSCHQCGDHTKPQIFSEDKTAQRRQCLAPQLQAQASSLVCWGLKQLRTWSCAHCHSGNPRNLKSDASSSACALCTDREPGWQHICVQHCLLDVLSPLMRPTVQILWKYYCSLTVHRSPRAPTKMYNEINLVLMTANTIPILQLIDQRVIVSFKSYNLRKTFRKAMILLMGLGKVNWKRLERIHHFTCIRNCCDSWEEVRKPRLTGAWKMLIPTLMDNLAVQDTERECACRRWSSQKTRVSREPKDTQLPQPHGERLWMRSCLS